MAALRQPFKHEATLVEARRNVERINQQMAGHDEVQPALDPELEALQRVRRAAFPSPPTLSRPAATPAASAGRSGVAGRGAGRTGGLDRN